MKRIFVATILAIILMGSISLHAQSMGPRIGKHRFLSEDGIARIPFRPSLDHIVLTALVNGKSDVRLILDTGMPMPGLILVGKENKDQLDMNFVTEMPVPGEEGTKEPLMARVAEGVSLVFPGLELTELTAIVEPAAGNLGTILEDDDGIIGFELFSRFAVTIDYDKYEIILTEPGKVQIPPDAEALPLAIRDGLPWINCSAEMIDGAIVPLELVADLGGSHALSLNVGTHDDIVPPDNAVEVPIGRTVSGEIYGKVGRIKGLHLGALTLFNVISSFQTGPRHGPSVMEKHGNLGHGVFRRFNVTFDYTKQRIILIPNSHFNDPFEYNMSGIIYSKTSNETLKVVRILPGSPAEKTQLRTGDIISLVNGRPFGDVGLDELRRILSVEGATVRLEASSKDGTIKNVTLTLRRII